MTRERIVSPGGPDAVAAGAAPGAGCTATCATCRWWRRDDHPGTFTALGMESPRVMRARVLDATPTGWCDVVTSYAACGVCLPLLTYADTCRCALWVTR